MSMSVAAAPTTTSIHNDEPQCEEVLCSMVVGDDIEAEQEETPQFIPAKPGSQHSSSKKRFSTAARISSHKLYAASINSQPLHWSHIFPDKGSEAQPTDASSLLKQIPRGAYTTCRTISKGTQIYQFDYHVQRLVTSAQAMIDSGIVDGSGKNKNNDYSEVTDYQKVRNTVLSSIKSTIQQFRNEFQHDMLPCDEFRITLLSTWLPSSSSSSSSSNHHQDSNNNNNKQNNCNMYCHVTILPYRDTQNTHIKVEIHGHGRSNAIAKDSQWISDREDSTAHNCEEYILVNEHCEMLEGTQTNFYVVVPNHGTNNVASGVGGLVVTAEEGILKGSVRDSVLRVCKQHDIPVQLRPPTLSDLQYATGAFLSSTSRLVMPIHEAVVNVSTDDFGNTGDTQQGDSNELLVGSVKKGQSYHFPDCKLTKRIQRLVAEDVLTHCVSIE